MCAARGRRPHELAADILLEAIRAAQHDHEIQEIVQARNAAGAVPARGGAPAGRGRQMSPASIALSGQLLAALDEEGTLPISTTALHSKLGSRPCYGTVLQLLNRLARLGAVEKIELEDMRCRYWRRLPGGDLR